MGGVVSAVGNTALNPLGITSSIANTAGGLLGGVAGGLAGPGNTFQAKPAQVTSPVSVDQSNAAQQASLNQLQQQQSLASQLAGAGGLQTQQNVLQQQQALANQLGSTAANQPGIFQAQQDLANQLALESQGQGPNPAQQQYKQNIDAATQAAAGTIASQKGISPALAAELISRQQSSAGQNAAGQAATLQAQQQLSAQGQLQQQQAALQGTTQTAAQQQANQQAAMQQVAQGQVGQQIAGQQNLTGATQNQQQMLLNAITGTNAQNISAQNSANEINSGVASGNAARQSQMVGGLLNAGGSIAAKAMAKGGEVTSEQPENSLYELPDHLQTVHVIYHGTMRPKQKIKQPIKKACGGYTSYQSGGKVPGEPKVDRNSYSNDTVKALLSPGEIVIPLNVMKSSDPIQGAANFVQAVLEKKGKESSINPKEEFHMALKEAMNKRRKK